MTVQCDSTAGLPASDRAGEWASIVSRAYFPLDIRFRDPERFEGRMERRKLGPVLLTHLESEAVEYERSRDQTRDLQIEDFLVAIPFASAVRFQ